MGWFDSGWGLSLTVFLPLVGVAVVMLIPRAQEQLIKQTALLFALASFAASVIVGLRFDYGVPGFQLDTNLNIPAVKETPCALHETDRARFSCNQFEIAVFVGLELVESQFEVV